jgi:hypothetical protein
MWVSEQTKARGKSILQRGILLHGRRDAPVRPASPIGPGRVHPSPFGPTGPFIAGCHVVRDVRTLSLRTERTPHGRKEIDRSDGKQETPGSGRSNVVVQVVSGCALAPGPRISRQAADGIGRASRKCSACIRRIAKCGGDGATRFRCEARRSGRRRHVSLRRFAANRGSRCGGARSNEGCYGIVDSIGPWRPAIPPDA